MIKERLFASVALVLMLLTVSIAADRNLKKEFARTEVGPTLAQVNQRLMTAGESVRGLSIPDAPLTADVSEDGQKPTPSSMAAASARMPADPIESELEGTPEHRKGLATGLKSGRTQSPRPEVIRLAAALQDRSAPGQEPAGNRTEDAGPSRVGATKAASGAQRAAGPRIGGNIGRVAKVGGNIGRTARLGGDVGQVAVVVFDSSGMMARLGGNVGSIAKLGGNQGRSARSGGNVGTTATVDRAVTG